MNIMKDMTRKIQCEGRMDAHNSWCVSSWLPIVEKRGSTQNGMRSRWCHWLCEMNKKGHPWLGASPPHFGFAMVEVDACVGPEFLFHNGVRFCGPARQTCDVDVIQGGTQLLIARQPCLGLNEGLMLGQCEEHGHEGISLLSSLPLRDVLGDP